MQIVATDSKAWGKAWHVPSNEAKSQKELVTELAAVAKEGMPTIPGMDMFK
jgi:hypothetical protein